MRTEMWASIGDARMPVCPSSARLPVCGSREDVVEARSVPVPTDDRGDDRRCGPLLQDRRKVNAEAIAHRAEGELRRDAPTR
jgi:hypothetical protein